MRDLHDEVRAAFEKEQAPHPPAAGMRRSIVEATTSRPRRELRLQWMAVAAALVITALVIVSLVSSRLAVHPNAPSHSAPAGDYGPPPAGVSLFYLQDPKHPGWYTGFDWTGKPRATIKLAEPLGSSGTLNQAPDGSAFAVAPLGKGHYEQFLDRLGSSIVEESQSSYQSQLWSDDSSRLCTLDYVSGEWRIGVRAPGGTATERPVAFGPSVDTPGIYAEALASCSPRNDRAVVTYNFMGLPTQVWTVRLSDGSILLHQSYNTNLLANIVASQDGALIAANSSKSVGYIGGPTEATTTVVRLSDGVRLMQLDPSIGVLAFSADNRTVLVSTSPWASGIATHLAVMDVATGGILWTYDGDQELAGFFVAPTGTGFAVLLQSPTEQASSHPAVQAIVVGADGTAHALHGSYQRP